MFENFVTFCFYLALKCGTNSKYAVKTKPIIKMAQNHRKTCRKEDHRARMFANFKIKCAKCYYLILSTKYIERNLRTFAMIPERAFLIL